MEIKQSIEGTTLRLALSGRLGANTTSDLEDIVKNKLDGVNELILDLKGLEFVSSAGLRVFLTAQKKMDKQGRMFLINVNDAVMEIFRITGFVDILNIR